MDVSAGEIVQQLLVDLPARPLLEARHRLLHMTAGGVVGGGCGGDGSGGGGGG